MRTKSNETNQIYDFMIKITVKFDKKANFKEKLRKWVSLCDIYINKSITRRETKIRYIECIFNG